MRLNRDAITTQEELIEFNKNKISLQKKAILRFESRNNEQKNKCWHFLKI